MSERTAATIERIRDEVRKMDKNLSESDEAFDAAVLLLAIVATAGPVTTRRLARFTKIEEGRVAEYLRRLRANRVLKRGGLAVEWFEPDGAVSFWLDVCVAMGHLARSRA